MDEYKLKAFLSIHIREGAWQAALLCIDKIPSGEPPWNWFKDARNWPEDKKTIRLSLYSSTSGILKAWPKEYDPDLVTLCKAITDRDWKVTELILCNSRISNDGWKNLITVVTQCGLYSLTLYYSGLPRPEFKYLCQKVLSRDCNLTSLNVSYNKLEDKGIRFLSAVLTSAKCKLTSLNVSRTYFESEVFQHLCGALTSRNCTLTRLNVSFNREEDRALKDLARTLASTKCILTSLDISYTAIGDEGINNLCEALTDPKCKLRSLNLYGNWTSPSAVNELREAMDKYELKAFLTIHIREGAWQVVLLFMDELPSHNLPWGFYHEMWYEDEDEEKISSSSYSSTSDILWAWPTEYDPDLVTL
ncbi:NACHT, LRR and PYD domains-containing protein 13 [Stylophora pistillata]|uniref:NACHT, LRR and PYD domains-containing protein 13 n=1 Tax=Stylophora pistillata TaxID=50429 RepID=A0A2B4SIK8_STYPI|nr:NACHT, LRR and PYD domains-containing protein 13 [Stylophora pistillata]